MFCIVWCGTGGRKVFFHEIYVVVSLLSDFTSDLTPSFFDYWDPDNFFCEIDKAFAFSFS